MAAYFEYGLYLEEMLPELLHNLGLSYTRKFEPQGTREEDRVTYMEVDQWHYDWWGYYFWMNTMPLPKGVNCNMVLDPVVSETLQINLNRRVKVEYNNRYHDRPGLWVIIYHNEVQNQRPRHVKFNDAFRRLPKNSTLELPIGFSKPDSFHYVDLNQSSTCHVLVGGTTGLGKSVILNVFLSALLKQMRTIVQPAPDKKELVRRPSTRFFLVDLKEGVEFNMYSGLDVLGGDVRFYVEKRKKKATYEDEVLAAIRSENGKKKNDDVFSPLTTVAPGYRGKKELMEPLFYGKVIRESDKVDLMLDYFYAEAKRRGELFRDANVRNITDWNKKSKQNQLSDWVCVIDEMSELIVSGNAKTTHAKISNMAAKVRAFGIHLILCTQYPKGEVVPKLIAANVPVRVAFWCSDPYQSEALLDNRKAHRDLSAHPGEAILQHGKVEEIVQAPFQSDFMNKSIVATVDKAVREGKPILSDAERYQNIDPGEVWIYALDVLAGFCSQRKLSEKFRPIDELKKILADYEVMRINDTFDPVITIDKTDYPHNGDYVLAPSRGGNTARKLVLKSTFEAEYEKKWAKFVRGASREAQTGPNDDTESKISRKSEESPNGQPAGEDKQSKN